MSSLKLQVVRNATGDTSVDFRGDKFKGAPEDNHRTFAEIDPAPQGLIDLVLAEGPVFNAFLKQLETFEPGFAGNAAALLGLSGSGAVQVRARLYDS